ncbi:MAG: ABC transporter permease [Christensenellaceae bacterium]|nr:ABC transporter permease [Christensenellaceae bacterium]
MRLFFQELKRISKSLIFFGLVIAFVLALTSQLGFDSHEFKEPDPHQEYHGHYLTDDLSYIYPNLMSDLQSSVDSNHFATYPYGFYREKNLEQDEIDVIKEIMVDLTGLPYEEINVNSLTNIPDREKLETQLDKIDAIIGGGSFYAKDEYQVHFGNKGMTYEDALADYKLIQENGYDVAFARYFCDYAGIFALLLSWFIGLYVWNKDRKEGIAHTIFVKQVSSQKLILTRIIAMSLALLFIVLVVFTYYEIKLLMMYGLALLNPLKAYILVIMWVFPIILFVVSLSSFLTIATNSILLGFLGPIFSMVYLMSSSANIFYNVGYGLLLRYNTVGNEAYFLSKLNTFLASRAIWLAISIFLIIITTFVYERRRRGFHAFKNKISVKRRAKA